MNIDLIFLIPLVVLIIVAMATYYNVLNMWVAFTGCIMAFAITWMLAPYQELIITPLASSLWFGHTWGLLEMIAIVHIGTIFTMVGIAVYNLYMTGGKKVWA